MKTTEIFVEQVLIGLLVLATGYLPYIHHDKITEFFKEKSLVDGAVIIAIAYLLGIVLDRFADTLLSRLEQYHRLKFAFKNGNTFKASPGSDPFPQDCLEIKILKDGKDANERIHYLRSRIRLSRALAIFIPALTISGLLSLVQDSGQDKDTILVFLVSITLIYVLCFIIVAFVLNELPKTNKIDVSKQVSSFYVWKFIYIYVEKLPKLSNNDKSDKREYERFSWWWEPTTIAAAILVSTMIYIAVRFHPKHACVVLLTGLGISFLSAWSWWRISQTYMQFLMDFKKCEDNNAPAKMCENYDIN